VRLAALGWTLALGARRLERLEETAASVVEAGGKAFAHPLDITDPASVDAFFAAAEDAVGPIDAVVNNAGAAMPGPIEQVTAEAVRRDVETNLTGPLLVARRAIATLKQKGLRGDVLFISSAAAGTPWTGIRSLYLRVGNTITEFSAGWGPELLMESSLYWRDLRIIRHDGLLSVEQVADAVAVALATPPGVHLESMTVHPEAP
jgi:NADP-dependent 3-hydroxy acid dehydrogenase YdfG